MTTTPITNRRPAERRGFTLIELLVVIVIIMLLVSIMVSSLSHFRAQAARAKTQTLLTTIATGLSQYHLDFNMYPPSYASSAYSGAPEINDDEWFGAEMLAQAMMGYINDPNYDGAEGYGFRVIPRGQVRGPYVSPEKFDTTAFAGGDKPCFADTWGRAVLYYRFDDPNDRYYPSHNPQANNQAPDIGAYAREDGSGPWYRRDYLLLSPGPDGQWRDPDDPAGTSDDVTNLLTE